MRARLMQRFGVTAALAMAIMLSGCTADAGPTLRLQEARVRALIPGQDKTVAYFELTNRGPATTTLIGAESDFSRAIELHTTTLIDGIMRMRRLNDVVIKPGKTVSFQPGGNHLMLFGVTSLAAHNQIRFHFADGTVLSTEFRRIPFGGQ